MRKYESPVINKTGFEEEDIITVSFIEPLPAKLRMSSMEIERDESEDLK